MKNNCPLIGARLYISKATPILVTVFLSGCTTLLTGGKAENYPDGLEYSLPAPHFVFTPQPDGTITVETIYMPDPHQRYTLRISSYFSTSKLDLKTANGLLTSVSLEADSSATSKKLIDTMTELKDDRMKKEESKRKEQKQIADAEKAETKKQADEIRSEEEKLVLLKDKLSVYESEPVLKSKKEEIASIKLLISQTKKTIELKRENAGLPNISAGNQADSFNDPKANNNVDTTVAYGPAVFRMLPAGEGAILVGEPQERLVVGVSTGGNTGSVEPAIEFTPPSVKVAPKSNSKTIFLSASRPVDILIDNVELIDPAIGMTNAILKGNAVGITVDPSKTRLAINLPSTLKPGIYDLNLVYQTSNSGRVQKTVVIEWLKD